MEPWLILGGAGNDDVLTQAPGERGVRRRFPWPEFEESWSGKLMLITKRTALPDSLRQFNISWFIPALLKYKRLFGEVLLLSFFLQLFGLVTPLFFQVVIDKVLVHKGLTTLDVLAIGLMVVFIFEVVMGGLRTWLFSHTSYRGGRNSRGPTFFPSRFPAIGVFQRAPRGRLRCPRA